MPVSRRATKRFRNPVPHIFVWVRSGLQSKRKSPVACPGAGREPFRASNALSPAKGRSGLQSKRKSPVACPGAGREPLRGPNALSPAKGRKATPSHRPPNTALDPPPRAACSVLDANWGFHAAELE